MNTRLRRLVAVLGLVLLCGGCATSAQRAERLRGAKRATSLLELGADHLKNGRRAIALREFLRAEELDPRNPRIQYALGKAYWARDRRVEAERHFRRALALVPSHHDARMDLCALLIQAGRYEEAVEQADILIADATFPAPWTALGNRGFSELQLGRLDDARRSLEEALAFSPSFWPATLSLAILESQSGRPQRAVGLFQELLSIAPGPSAESEANFRLAEVYLSLGNRSHALAHLNAAVARQPEGPWARKSAAYLEQLH